MKSKFSKYTQANFIRKIMIRRYINDIKNLIKTSNVKKILDVGCGGGFIENYLFNQIVNVDIYGIDSDKESISMAMKINNSSKFKVCNIYSLGWAKKHFNMVICLEVLEHLKHFHKALSELKNIEADYYIFSVPYEPFFSLMNIIGLKYLRRLGHHPEHCNFWTKREFINLVNQYFHIDKIKIAFPWIILLCKYL